jgi:MFS family permease
MLSVSKILKSNGHWLALGVVLVILLRTWAISGYDSLHFDSDLARDLREISNIQQGQIVWLGPWLGPGFHASSIYYYYFYPFLELSGGSIGSMVTFNLLTGFVAILFFGLLATRKYGYKGVSGAALLGLVPMMTENILHPGNGFTYMYFVIICLTALWFKVPLFVASFAGGMALAFHPATGFLPIFLLIEWWRRGKNWLSAVLNLGFFLVPMAPLIAFEVITKGYIIRSWLERPSTNDITVKLGLENLLQVCNLLGLSHVELLSLLAIAGFICFNSKSSKLKVWFVSSIFFLVFILFFHNLIWRYLFGIALMILFLISVTFIKYRATSVVITCIACSLFFRSPLIHPYPVQTRSISRVESIADFIDQQSLVSKSEKLAVVAAVSVNTEVPQADEYRFLLRNKGYQVVDISAHADADTLLMVLEVPNFNWQGWSNWELQSFGDKKVEKVEELNGVTVVTFSRL